MKQLRIFIKDTIVGGLLFLVPLFILIEVGKEIWQFFNSLGGNLVSALGFERLANAMSTTLLTTIFIMLVCFLFGLMAKWAIASRIRNLVDAKLKSIFPFYEYYRTLIHNRIQPQDAPPRPAILVRQPGGWKPGIVVEEYSTGEKVVFMPLSPKITDGEVFLVPPEDTRPSDLTEATLKEVLLAQGKGLVPQ